MKHQLTNELLEGGYQIHVELSKRKYILKMRIYDSF